MIELLHVVTDYLIQTIGSLGYIGIFFLMFLESTFFPFPSEIVMIPAGFLAYQGEMNIYMVLAMGILGSLLGALFNYYLSRSLGRKLLLKYGHYVKIDEDKLVMLETFFKKHGEISTFNGRLIPVVRQLISLPAGLSNMNVFKFSLYTTFGAGIWVFVLTYLGYFLGNQQYLIKEYLSQITLITLVVISIGTILYLYLHKRKNKS